MQKTSLVNHATMSHRNSTLRFNGIQSHVTAKSVSTAWARASQHFLCQRVAYFANRYYRLEAAQKFRFVFSFERPLRRLRLLRWQVVERRRRALELVRSMLQWRKSNSISVLLVHVYLQQQAVDMIILRAAVTIDNSRWNNHGVYANQCF